MTSTAAGSSPWCFTLAPVDLCQVEMAAHPLEVTKSAGSLPQKDLDAADVESSKNVEGVVVADTARVLDHKAEVKLCRKFDIRILPVLACMCKSTRQAQLI